MPSMKPFLLAASLFALPVLASGETPPATGEAAKPAEKCEHGVKKSLCARCNPKLAAVFKKKGDWCGEHQRPESQCAICKPALQKDGVKP